MRHDLGKTCLKVAIGEHRHESLAPSPAVPRAHAGDVVYSSIDLWKGCIAVVPRAFEGALVTKEFPIYQITVQKYHEMIQKGILTEDDPVELLEGWIVPKMPRYPLHDGTIQRTNRLLTRSKASRRDLWRPN